MAGADRLRYLRLALVLVGLICIVGIYPLTIIWPSGWSWHTGQSHYLREVRRRRRPERVQWTMRGFC